MINAVQGVDMLLSGANNTMGALGSGLADYRMNRSYEAAVQGYNAVVERYNHLLQLSTSVTERLQRALEAEKAETARLRAFLAKFK